jgi:hypothetical protein
MKTIWSKSSRWVRCGVLIASILFVRSAGAQTWQWTSEEADSAGSDTSLAVDQEGNLHVSYRVAEGGQLRYAFRPGGSSRWFKMTLDKDQGAFSTKIIVDPQGNPHICYTPRVTMYAHFDGKKWTTQRVDPGAGVVGFGCSILVTPDGRPLISWYLESGTYLRYAILQEGVWVVRSLDGGGGDLPGKWNSMGLDGKGNLHIAYTGFPIGQLRYGSLEGNNWHRTVLDTPNENVPDGERGMGNSMVFDAQGNPMISYMEEHSVRLARYVDGQWKKEIVAQLPPFGIWSWRIMHSSLVLDSQGNPHISFQSVLGLHHAWWNGTKWNSQLVLKASGDAFFDSSMSIDSHNVLYISYTDPTDGTLRVATGRPLQTAQTVKTNE